MTTDKQQPAAAPERIWISRHYPNVYRLERSSTEDVEFIPRVHSVDDARVGEIRERRTKAAALEARRGYNHPLERPTWADVDYLLSLLPQLSSSERRELPHWTEPPHEASAFDRLLEPLANALASITSDTNPLIKVPNYFSERVWTEFWDAERRLLVLQSRVPTTAPTQSSERRCGEVDAERQAAAIVTTWRSIKDHDDKLLVRYIKRAITDAATDPCEGEQRDKEARCPGPTCLRRVHWGEECSDCGCIAIPPDASPDGPWAAAIAALPPDKRALWATPPLPLDEDELKPKQKDLPQ